MLPFAFLELDGMNHIRKFRKSDFNFQVLFIMSHPVALISLSEIARFMLLSLTPGK